MKRKIREISQIQPSPKINIDDVLTDLYEAIDLLNHRRVVEILDYCRKNHYKLGQQSVNLMNFALGKDDLETIKILIFYKIALEAEQHERFSYLTKAARGNKVNTLKVFLQHFGSESHRSSYHRGRNILQEAILGDAKDTFKFLIEKYAEDKEFLEHKDDFGDTPLHKAVFKNDALSVKLLLQSKVDSTIKNNKGYTAKDLAKNIPELRACFEVESTEKKAESLTDAPQPLAQSEMIANFIKTTGEDLDNRTVHQLREENVFLSQKVATLEHLVFDLHTRLRSVEQRFDSLPPSNQYFQAVGAVNILANSMMSGIKNLTDVKQPTESAAVDSTASFPQSSV